MPVVGIRELSRETAKVLKGLLEGGEPVVITKQGKPIATLTPVEAGEAEDLVLGLAPEILETSSTEEVEIAPRKTRTLDELSEELVAEAAQSAEGREALAMYGEDLEQRRIEVSAEVARVFEDANERAQQLVESAMAVSAYSANKAAFERKKRGRRTKSRQQTAQAR